MSLSTVIFDLDGTLIDSEANYHHSDQQFLEARGIHLPEEHWKDVVGVGSRSFLRTLQRDYGLTGDLDDLLAEKDSCYLKIARGNTRAFPQMQLFVEACHSRGIKMAVASGSSREAIEKTLGWAGLGQYFPVRVSADEVAGGKPQPDIFIEAARRMGVDPGECLVIEDSQYGVTAGKAAGMVCAAIPTVTTPPLAEAFLQADILFPGGMTEFTAEGLIHQLTERFQWRM